MLSARPAKTPDDYDSITTTTTTTKAYGHGGTGMVVTALTDNVNRAIAEVKACWKKSGLKQAASGSVLFQFAKRGRIEVQGEVDEEQVR